MNSLNIISTTSTNLNKDIRYYIHVNDVVIETKELMSEPLEIIKTIKKSSNKKIQEIIKNNDSCTINGKYYSFSLHPKNTTLKKEIINIISMILDTDKSKVIHLYFNENAPICIDDLTINTKNGMWTIENKYFTTAFDPLIAQSTPFDDECFSFTSSVDKWLDKEGYLDWSKEKGFHDDLTVFIDSIRRAFCKINIVAIEYQKKKSELKIRILQLETIVRTFLKGIKSKDITIDSISLIEKDPQLTILSKKVSNMILYIYIENDSISFKYKYIYSIFKYSFDSLNYSTKEVFEVINDFERFVQDLF